MFKIGDLVMFTEAILEVQVKRKLEGKRYMFKPGYHGKVIKTIFGGWTDKFGGLYVIRQDGYKGPRRIRGDAIEPFDREIFEKRRKKYALLWEPFVPQKILKRPLIKTFLIPLHFTEPSASIKNWHGTIRILIRDGKVIIPRQEFILDI